MIIFLIVLLLLSIAIISRKNNLSYKSQYNLRLVPYIINLERDIIRMNNLSNNLDGKFKRFPAINGNELDIEELKRIGMLRIDDNSFPYSKHITKDTLKGSIGCALSHIRLWKSLKSTPGEHFLILEDDSIIDVDILDNINKYIKDVPDDWDILFLGGSRVYGRRVNNNIIKAEYINNWMNCGLFAYIIKKSAINKLLKKAVPITNYIDMQINKFYGNDIKAYYTYPTLIKHNYDYGSTRDVNKSKYDNKFVEEAERFYLI